MTGVDRVKVADVRVVARKGTKINAAVLVGDLPRVVSRDNSVRMTVHLSISTRNGRADVPRIDLSGTGE